MSKVGNRKDEKNPVCLGWTSKIEANVPMGNFKQLSMSYFACERYRLRDI